MTDSARILIIEDDEALNNQVADLLRARGYQVSQCRDGQQGLLMAMEDKFDLILLDILLPSLDGLSVLNRLRQSRNTPIMMLTACGAEEARIEGYSKGADDYLPKPFSFNEMLVRIEALLRRAGWSQTPAVQKNQLTQGQLLLDRKTMQAKYADQAVDLTPIQFRLLWVLVENHQEPLSKAYLYQAVLERPFSRYDRSLDMHLSRVRRRLVEAGMAADRIVTVHGKGYCFA